MYDNRTTWYWYIFLAGYIFSPIKIEDSSEWIEGKEMKKNIFNKSFGIEHSTDGGLFRYKIKNSSRLIIEGWAYKNKIKIDNMHRKVIIKTFASHNL